MKKLIAVLTLCLATVVAARANENVVVINPTSKPVPVQGSDVIVNTTLDLNHITAAPGTTPSPSPAKAMVVQGISGATEVGIGVPSSTRVSSTAYEASHVLKNAAGTLLSVAGYNSGPQQFIQLFNSTTVPANTAVPVAVFTVPATSNFSYDVPVTGIPFTTGIAVSNSSTGPTKTIGSADCYFTAVVK